MDRVRVGVVSTSWYADTLHLPSLNSHPGAEVAAICGRNRARAEAMAGKHRIPGVYTEYEEMFARAGLDAVVLAPPDDLHFAMTMAAVDAGLHVVCEKPLALNAEQARMMAEKADRAGIKHMTFFTLRWLPHTRYLYELVAGGYLGDCTHCRLAYVSGGAAQGDYRWRYDGARANGVLGDLGSHLIDLAMWLNGDVKRVSAHLANYVDRVDTAGNPVKPANDSAMLQMEFANGSQGSIYASSVVHVGAGGLVQQIGLYGRDGSLESDFQFGNFGGAGETIAIRGVRSPEQGFVSLEIPGAIWGDATPGKPLEVFEKNAAGDRYFIDAILNDTPVEPDFYAGLRVQEVIDAALASQQTRRWVDVSEAPSVPLASGVSSQY